MQTQPFSKLVESWLHTKTPKTLGSLVDVFGKSSFATVFILCMSLPALPIPTGGITHVLEVVVIFVALQTIIGLKNLWLPQKLAHKPLPQPIVKKALPVFIGYLKKLEKYSRPRGAKFLNNTWTERFAGVSVLAFTIGALVAIPFSNLDTLVSIGVVVLSLGLVLNDIVYFIAGLVIGCVGLVLEITVGAIIARAMQKLWTHVGLEVRLAMLAVVVLLIILVVIHHRKKK